MSSRSEQITELRAAIAAQEAMRSTVGDATIELSLKPLRSLLESLLAQQTAPPRSQATAQDQALLAQLQSYIPKQLADKLRSSGYIEGERRQATVIFADISGFTMLAERLDPEEVAAFLNDCMKELIDAIYEHEGLVNQIIGDCVMAVFGAPIALEDDAERALRATLAMRERLEAFNERWIDKLEEPLALHTGVNSGTVIAGNVGSDLRMRGYTVIGDTVNVASRLEGIATRGQILVSQSTYRLTHGIFDFRPIEPIRVKGKKELLTVFELIDAKPEPGKMRGLEGLTSPLVGRAWESKVLRKAIAATRLGRSAIVLVHGDAGVGKSRLLAEARACESEGLMWLEGRCVASSGTLSYAPVLDLLRRHIGLTDKQAIEEQQAVLRRYSAANCPADPQVYPVLARLLTLPLAQTDAELIDTLKGEEFRARFFSIVEQRLLSFAEDQPLVVIIDDLHWADQSTIDLLAYLLPLTKRARFTFIGLSRSRQRPINLWDKLDPVLEDCRDHLVEIPLETLSVDASRTLVTQLLGGDCLPESLAAEILDKSEGNPFFLEEVLRSLIDSGGLLLAESKWTVTPLASALRVPDTLQGVLLSRLDRLSEELKELTQKAAVIGRVFLFRVLERISTADASLNDQLNSLEILDLVHEHSRLPEIEYVFKHALTQEVAYQTLLTPARKALHRKVGDALEALFRDRLDEFAGVLAYHFFSADSWQKALDYSIRSGDAAFRVCAYTEARGHYGRVLECLKHLEPNPQHLREKVETTIQLVASSLYTGLPETHIAMLTEAEENAQLLNDPVQVARAQLWIGRAHFMGGNPQEAVRYYHKVVLLSTQLEDPELAALPRAVIGRVLFMQGRFKESLEMLNEAILSLEREKNRHELLFAYVHRGLAQTGLGHYAAGLSGLNRTLEIARASHDQNAETMAHAGLAFAQLLAGEYKEGIASAQEALAVAEKCGDTYFRYPNNAFIAWGMTGLGRSCESLPYWAAAKEAEKAFGGRVFLQEWFAALEAESLIDAVDPATGLRRAQEALEFSQNAESIIGEALAERTIGRALASNKEGHAEALLHLKRSVEICEKIGARFELVRSLLAEGAAHVVCDNRAEAVSTLTQAQAMARECQLEREESIARDLLAKLTEA